MMNFIKILRADITHFASDEDGAVTVDWVVLTAAVCGLAVAAYTSIKTGATGTTAATATYMGTLAPGSM
ncbi:MAG: hypothetical protein WBB25_09835 [Sulfitobacter sp.]